MTVLGGGGGGGLSRISGSPARRIAGESCATCSSILLEIGGSRFESECRNFFLQSFLFLLCLFFFSILPYNGCIFKISCLDLLY